MATLRGNDGIVKIGANAIAEVTAWSLDQELELIEDTAMGDNAKRYKAGVSDGSGSLTCHYDPSDTTGQQQLSIGAELSLLVFPENDQSGDLQLAFDIVITNVSRSGEMNAPVGKEISFQVNGDIVESNVA